MNNSIAHPFPFHFNLRSALISRQRLFFLSPVSHLILEFSLSLHCADLRQRQQDRPRSPNSVHSPSIQKERNFPFGDVFPLNFLKHIGEHSMPAHRMISRNIHEYISYITRIPKCERCYYAGPGYSSYVRPRMEIGSRSLEGRVFQRKYM